MNFQYFSLIIFLISSIVALGGYSFEGVDAVSPSFVRQEIKDAVSDDGWNHVNGEFTSRHEFADLSTISYSSDGRFLNATLFMRNSTEEKPIVDFIAYGMLIDIDSDYRTGWQGYDYMMKISRNSNINNWTYLVQEWSLDSITRILDQKHNFKAHLDYEKSRYVYLSLDLEKINYPNKYLVVFFTDYDYREGDDRFEISDYSNTVLIPPPQFRLSASPNSVSLRPGEEKTVEIQVNSSTEVFESHVNFSTNQINGLETYFIPNERDIPEIGLATSHLNMKSLEGSEPNPYTLQIFANISFPTQYVGGETETTRVISESITEQTNLPIIILQPLTFKELFSDFWATFGDPISLVGGGFAAGFAALVFGKLGKKAKAEGKG